MTDCSVDGCSNKVIQSGLCESHRKRRTRGSVVQSSLREYGEAGWDAFFMAIDRYYDRIESPARPGEDPCEVSYNAKKQMKMAAWRWKDWAESLKARSTSSSTGAPLSGQTSMTRPPRTG